MGKSYVVTVFEVDDQGDETTLIELRAPIAILQQFAPQAIATALGTSAPVEAPEQPRMAMGGPAETPEQKTERRKRRTKAEMEAARRAELLAASIAEPHNAMIGELDNDGEPITLTEVMPIPVETPTSGSGYRPFG